MTKLSISRMRIQNVHKAYWQLKTARNGFCFKQTASTKAFALIIAYDILNNTTLYALPGVVL